MGNIEKNITRKEWRPVQTLSEVFFNLDAGEAQKFRVLKHGVEIARNNLDNLRRRQAIAAKLALAAAQEKRKIPPRDAENDENYEEGGEFAEEPEGTQGREKV